MKIDFSGSEQRLIPRLVQAAFPDPIFAATTALWLEACGYPGLQSLAEAVQDAPTPFVPERDVLGLDLRNISCARIVPAVMQNVLEHGRAFLRNVRHGLFLVPGSVEHNIGIGCPIDPAFALGGERAKNPYAERLEAARQHGIEVDDTVWSSLVRS